MECPENGIIFGTAMAEKQLENSKVGPSMGSDPMEAPCKVG